MTSAPITHLTDDGCVAWVDGVPPRFAIADTNEACIAAVLQDRRPTDAGSDAAVHPLELKIIVSRDGELPRLANVLQGIARSGRARVVLTLTGEDPLNEWERSAGWIEGFREHLVSTRSTLGTSVEIESTLWHVPDGFEEFVGRLAGWCRVRVLDKDEGEEATAGRLDRSARIADSGISVDAEVELGAHGRVRWTERARSWQSATRNGRVRFARAKAGGAEYAVAVAEFLKAVFEGGQFDLWRTEPFATLLSAMCAGVESIPRCGAAGVAAATRDDFVIGCRSGSRECACAARTKCVCAYSVLCAAFDTACRAETYHPRDRSVGARPQCDAVARLVPRFLEELAKATRYQQRLQDRASSERFRIAAREGNVRVWTEEVITDHRNRFERSQDGDDKHDLTRVRPRATGDPAVAAARRTS